MTWDCVVLERTLFIVKPENITASLPDPVTFCVKATSDPDTPITYIWYRYTEDSAFEDSACEDNWCELFNASEKTYIANDNGSSLTILNTDRSDLGTYRCVASNDVSQDVVEMKLLSPKPSSGAELVPVLSLLLSSPSSSSTSSSSSTYHIMSDVLDYGLPKSSIIA